VVEVPAADRSQVTTAVLDEILATMRPHAPQLDAIGLDPEPYAPGRAFVQIGR
jgi:hypothetical protein